MKLLKVKNIEPIGDVDSLYPRVVVHGIVNSGPFLGGNLKNGARDILRLLPLEPWGMPKRCLPSSPSVMVVAT